MSRFEPVDPKVSFPALEEGILAFWKDADIFAKSLRLRDGSPEWVFYEGPPTANGRPGIHHVEPRTFKDVYPRFKTMTGYSVPRKAGWDCHGLPVELEVEKEIGTKTKSDIEAFGIEEFTRLCRGSVTRYVDDWEKLTERIGFWLDMSDAYWTMSTEYVQSVWWSLKRLFEDGLLVEDHKVTAYCPRCGTALSDAEVALGYEETEDPSVFLKLEITDCPADRDLVGARIAVWTTTPWTLLSNLGLAIDPAATYTVVEHDGQMLIIAEPLREKVLPEATELGDLPGELLVGARYAPPFENVDEGSTHTIVAGDFVSMEEGTGVVHIAPAFGSDDLEIGRANGWPVYNPVDAEGKFTGDVPEYVHGRFVKDADAHIVEDLGRRGLLLRAETYTHSYPFCWRCRTPLLYYARTSWYIRTTAKKGRLLEVNQGVNWFPEHIKDGRYGNWLENNVDWALSRDRYWGTPLPIWRCEDGHTTVIGSLAELGELADRDVRNLDPHRPAIDGVILPCPNCGKESRRLTEVIDAWYDSGAMPFAQWGYPYADGSRERFESRFPADFISEAIDQTRGWFYTLMAEGVLHFDDTAYRNVVCLGHIVDADGRKMSKSLGNVIDPWEVLDRQGADALRWFLVTSGSPWTSRRVSMEILDQSVRQFLLTLWNVYSFFVTYANADGFDPETAAEVPADERPLLDRWLLSQLADTVGVAREGLEAYDATGAGRRIATFVDDLSNWYVRRARRRFWDPTGDPNGADKVAAYRTLHESLLTLSQLLAPFTPFVAEELWRNLSGPGAAESVHLSDYPDPGTAAPDADLDIAMQAARDIASLGRTVRADARVKVRQPLTEAIVHYAGDHDALQPLLGVIAEELNVKDVVFTGSAEQLGGWSAKPNFKVLGPKLGKRVKALAEVLAADDGTLAGALGRGERVQVSLGDFKKVELEPADVDLTQETKAGWGMATDGALTVALDLEPTPALRQEGIARDLVRVIQDARKAADLDVSDRIELGISASGDVTQAVETFGDYIRGETLARSMISGELEGDAHREEAGLDEVPIVVTLRPV
ncbi:MAG: isoleucine--tRNA ligase [Actinomycetota bacterium]